MARTARDVEAYLMKLERRFVPLDEATYLVPSGGDCPPVAVRVTERVVVVRAEVGPAPRDAPAAEARLFRRLLELNASELAHCAFGVDAGQVVLTAALDLENLDLNEIESALGDMDLALARHAPEVRELGRT
jgi:hypothetical protein